MEKEQFIKKLLAAAIGAGIEAAEVYSEGADSFRASSRAGEIDSYSVSSTQGLSLRGLYNGHMGYAATEAFDDEAVEMLISGVKESASLVEDDSVQEIYKGDESYPAIDNYDVTLDEVTEKQKLDFLLSVEQKAMASGDPRIRQIGRNMLSTFSEETAIANTYGLSLSRRDNLAVAFVVLVASEGQRVSTGMGFACGRDFSAFDADKIAKDAVEDALFYLNAAPVPSGTYRVIIDNRCMPNLLSTFAGVFSADSAQKGMSLLAGQEGQVIAAPCVTLMDDPHMPGGLASTGFDDEGVATSVKPIIENGTLTTLLHNLKTARKVGCRSTGNGKKGGYSAPTSVYPSNFYFKPGEKTLAQLMEDVGNGLVITSLEGLHAGANPISGDFSLSAKGYVIENGQKGRAVEQITLAGNFYTLLKNVRALANDLIFFGSPIGCPSMDVGEMTVAGC